MRRDSKRKNFGDLSSVKFSPVTDSQARAAEAYASGKNVVMSGYAGTGKTFVALGLALEDLFAGKTDRVVVYRSAVPTRDMGFMPGTMAEKQAPYEIPYRAVVSELCGRGDAYDILKKNGSLDFSTTSYLRGLTVHRSVIIVDEMQNMTFHELDSIATRVGRDTRMILCGDYDQTDLVRDTDRFGLRKFLEIAEGMTEFASVSMGPDDVVRSKFVKAYLVAKAARKALE